LQEKLKAGAKLEDFAVHKTAALRKASPKKRRRAKRWAKPAKATVDHRGYKRP